MVEPELTPLGESWRRHLAKGVAPCTDTGIGYGDTTFLKKPMWAKMDIRYWVRYGYGYVDQNGVSMHPRI